MGKQTSKKSKKSKKARKAEARRRRQQRNIAICAGAVLLCLVVMIVLAVGGRKKEPEGTWYIRNAQMQIAAPGAEEPASAQPEEAVIRLEPVVTPTPTPTPTPEPVFTPGPTPLVTPEPTAATITITAAGDCTLGGSVNQDTYAKFKRVVELKGYDYFFRNVRRIFEADDLTIVNLEGPLTDTGNGRHGMYCFKGDPEFVGILTGSSVELCNVANNHSTDFGTAGLKRTAEVLENAGVGCCGYSKVFQKTINGARVTALGFDKWHHDEAAIVEAVKRERESCDLLIVNVHWGREKVYEPMKDQVKWGHAAIDAGADLVIGTHSHVYGGVELYNGKYIVYSLGNFCFGGNGNPSDKRAMIFQQTFRIEPSGEVKDGGINIIPCMVSSIANKNNFQPIVMTQNAGASLLKNVMRYSNLGENTLWMDNCYPKQIGLQVTNLSTAARAVDALIDQRSSGDVASAQVPTDVEDEAPFLDFNATDDGEVDMQDSYTGQADSDYEGGYTGTADADYEGDPFLVS